MENRRPSKTNVNLGFASVEIGFLGVTISHVTLSCSQYFFHVNKKFFKIYGEPNVHKFCAIDIFGISPVVKQYPPFLSPITCLGVV